MKTEVPGDRTEVASTPDDAGKGESQTSEHGGPAGLEPTRYGDWEKKGRCIDF